jgi:hypothetical protein
MLCANTPRDSAAVVVIEPLLTTSTCRHVVAILRQRQDQVSRGWTNRPSADALRGMPWLRTPVVVAASVPVDHAIVRDRHATAAAALAARARRADDAPRPPPAPPLPLTLEPKPMPPARS